MRILKSHPLLKLVNSYVIDSPQPSISYLWNFGSLLALCLIIQIIPGIHLAGVDSHYPLRGGGITRATKFEVELDAPEPWNLFFQDNVSPLEGLEELHNNIMFYLAAILFAVSWIIVSIILNYNKVFISNKYINHGTLVELVWTITPALILILIAFPSFKFLYLMDEVIDPSLVINGEGHQWYWSYKYPGLVNNVPIKYKLWVETDISDTLLYMNDSSMQEAPNNAGSGPNNAGSGPSNTGSVPSNTGFGPFGLGPDRLPLGVGKEVKYEVPLYSIWTEGKPEFIQAKLEFKPYGSNMERATRWIHNQWGRKEIEDIIRTSRYTHPIIYNGQALHTFSLSNYVPGNHAHNFSQFEHIEYILGLPQNQGKQLSEFLTYPQQRFIQIATIAENEDYYVNHKSSANGRLSEGIYYNRKDSVFLKEIFFKPKTETYKKDFYFRHNG